MYKYKLTKALMKNILIINLSILVEILIKEKFEKKIILLIIQFCDFPSYSWIVYSH